MREGSRRAAEAIEAILVWGLKTIVRRQMRRAGFKQPKIGPDTLRHTFGTQYMLNGGDVFSLRRIM